MQETLPPRPTALEEAHAFSAAAAEQGFDWDEMSGVFAKLQEEIAELQQAIADNTNIEEELGDLLFCAVNLARHTQQNAELALYKANQKFMKRFRLIEVDLPRAQSAEAKQALWDNAKQHAGL